MLLSMARLFTEHDVRLGSALFRFLPPGAVGSFKREPTMKFEVEVIRVDLLVAGAVSKAVLPFINATQLES